MIAFTLSMPGVASWNGRWTGESRKYVVVRSLGRSRDAIRREVEIVSGAPYGYAFGDGWYASVGVREIAPAEARKLRRESAGFCGYDWMIDSIIQCGEIRAAVTVAV